MKNKGSVIIIIILLLGLCGSIGYIVYDKVVLKDNAIIEKSEKKNGTEAENVSTTKQLTENEVATFLTKIDLLNTFYSRHYPLQDVQDLKNQDVLFMGEILIVQGLYTEGGIVGFTGDRVRSAVAEYFGSDYHLKLEDIDCHVGDGVLYQYNAERDEYKRVGNHGHDGIGSARNKAFFQDGAYNPETDTYVIHTKVVSSSRCGGTCGPRIQFYNAFDYDNIIYNTEEDTDYDVVYREVSDKLSIVTYTFVKNSDGGYGLKSVSIE